MDYTINNEDLPLVITFQGFYSGMIPPFKRQPEDIPFYMYNMSKNYKNVNFLFLKDINQIWFQKGLYGNTDFDDLVNNIKTFIEKYNFSKVITIGSSAGGFSAILAGQLLNVDNIIAIDPQSLIGHETCLYSTNYRNFPGWQYRQFMLNKVSDKKYFDLNNLEYNTPVTIYTNEGKGGNPDLDHFMITRLINNENIKFKNANCDDHGLISKEELDKILLSL